jgi:hypothetical protein
MLYQLLINNLIDKYIYDKVSNNVDCPLLWDVLKIEIREATIIYCKSKSKFKRESRRSLEKRTTRFIITSGLFRYRRRKFR